MSLLIRARLPRLTIHRLMVAVAVAAVVLWGEIRRAHFASILRDLEAQWRELTVMCTDSYHYPTLEDHAAIMAKFQYLQDSHRIYQRAARYPWLPVGRVGSAEGAKIRPG